jgi:hypothetical protein
MNPTFHPFFKGQIMKHTAQDVLRAADAGKFPHEFTLEDAQKVLDASPEPVKIGRCLFIWIDEGKGLLKIHCTGQPRYTLNHPASSSLGEGSANIKKSSVWQRTERSRKHPGHAEG